MLALKIENVNKNYKDIKALDNISLEIENKKLYGLLGVNGAGKTTLINIIIGLIKKDSGKVTVFGCDLDHEMDQIKRIVNVSPQEVAIAGNLSVKENLEFFSDIYGVDKEKKVKELIDQFSLKEVLDQKAKTLSGGWKRRLSIAIALVSNPKILFLDEPTLGLDVIARRELWRIIEGLKNKTTIILTSHYLEEIEHLCDEVAILSKGHLLETGTIADIIKKSKSQNFEDAFVKIVEEGSKYEND